jgi:hypothetical protein
MSRARRTLSLVAASAVLAAVKLSSTGCSDAGSHIYTGEPFNPTLVCMEPLTGVDIVTGDQPNTPCSPLCILSPPEDGGIIAYVSTMCAPFPNYPNVINDQSNPLCVAALAAFNRDALCEDGGVVLPPHDAGPDADASADAAPDAPDAADASSPVDSAADASSPVDSAVDTGAADAAAD